MLTTAGCKLLNQIGEARRVPHRQRGHRHFLRIVRAI
jgi:hypothetical protein